MFDLRNVVLGVLAFSLTFGVGWWLGLARPRRRSGLVQGQRSAAAPQAELPEAKPAQVAVLAPQAPAPARS